MSVDTSEFILSILIPHLPSPHTLPMIEAGLMIGTLLMRSYSLRWICIRTSSRQMLVRCWTIYPLPLQQTLPRHSTPTGEVVMVLPNPNKKTYGLSRTLMRPRKRKLKRKLKRRRKRWNSRSRLMKVNYVL
jgi:hypothetical protein